MPVTIELFPFQNGSETIKTHLPLIQYLECREHTLFHFEQTTHEPDSIRTISIDTRERSHGGAHLDPRDSAGNPTADRWKQTTIRRGTVAGEDCGRGALNRGSCPLGRRRSYRLHLPFNLRHARFHLPAFSFVPAATFTPIF